MDALGARTQEIETDSVKKLTNLTPVRHGHASLNCHTQHMSSSSIPAKAFDTVPHIKLLQLAHVGIRGKLNLINTSIATLDKSDISIIGPLSFWCA